MEKCRDKVNLIRSRPHSETPATELVTPMQLHSVSVEAAGNRAGWCNMSDLLKTHCREMEGMSPWGNITVPYSMKGRKRCLPRFHRDACCLWTSFLFQGFWLFLGLLTKDAIELFQGTWMFRLCGVCNFRGKFFVVTRNELLQLGFGYRFLSNTGCCREDKVEPKGLQNCNILSPRLPQECSSLGGGKIAYDWGIFHRCCIMS